MQRLFWPRSSSTMQRRQQFYTLVCLLSVFVVYSYLAFVWLIPLGHFLYYLIRGKTSPVEVHWWHWIMVFVLLFLDVVMLVILTHLLRAFIMPRLHRIAARFRRVIHRLHNKSKQTTNEETSSVPNQVGASTVAQPEEAKASGSGDSVDNPASFRDRQTAAEQRSSESTDRLEQRDQARKWFPRTWLYFLARHHLFFLIIVLVGCMASYLFLNGRFPRWWWDYPGECLLFAARASNPANGVTPVVPILLIGVAFFIWSYAQLRRLYLLDQHAVDSPCPANGELLFQRIAQCHNEAARRLRKPRLALGSLGGVILWVLLFFMLSRLSSHFVPAAEGVLTEVPILASLAVLAMLILYAWLHLSKVWQSTRRVLNALALLPLQGAFRRLPLAITSLFGHYLASLKPRNRDIKNYQLHQREVLAAEYSRIADALDAGLDLTLDTRATLAKALAETDPTTLTQTAHACLLVLQHVKNNPRLAEQYLSKTADESKTSSNQTSRIHLWLSHAQQFVALEVMVYLSQFFVQMRNLAVPLSCLPLLMLIAVSSYPFQPQRLWLLLSMALTVLVVVLVISIIVLVERNELVSRIAGTTPHQLNFHPEFFSHILLYALPLLGVIVALSSDLSNLVHALADPLIQTLR